MTDVRQLVWAVIGLDLIEGLLHLADKRVVRAAIWQWGVAGLVGRLCQRLSAAGRNGAGRQAAAVG